jgi:hypothetical protein
VTTTRLISAAAATAALATTLAAPALADPPPFSGTYTGGDAESVWVVETQCQHEGCMGTVSSNQGWRVPAKMVGGLWHFIITKPDGVICNDGSYAPAYIKLEVDPNTLNGLLLLDDNYSCPGGNVTTTPFKLTKVS